MTGARWLERSGQSWSLRVAESATTVGVGLSIVGFVGAAWLQERVGAGAVVPLVLGFVLMSTSYVLPLLIRCRVCGLHLESYSGVRERRREEWLAWIESLQSCPVCGDEGDATQQSRARWLASGAKAESPYWSRRRLLALFVGATAVLWAAALVGLSLR